MNSPDFTALLAKHVQLEHQLASANWWLGVFTAVVAIGIFVEVTAELLFSREKPRAEIVVVLLAGLVVLAGVVGEYSEGEKVAREAHQLQQMADHDVAALYEQGADANERAAHANIDAAAADERAARAYKLGMQTRLAEAKLRRENLLLEKQTTKSATRIATLTKEAAASEARIASAEKDAAVANEKAEAERLARVGLEKSLAWRSLTAAQVRKIALSLAPFAGEHLDIFVYRDEPDAWMLGAMIATALSGNLTPSNPHAESETLVFRKRHWWGDWYLDLKTSGLKYTPGAGWNVKIFRVVELDRVGIGLDVETSPLATDRDIAAANALAIALKRAGLLVDGPTEVSSPPRRIVQLLSGTGGPDAPISLTVLFRPSLEMQELHGK